MYRLNNDSRSDVVCACIPLKIAKKAQRVVIFSCLNWLNFCTYSVGLCGIFSLLPFFSWGEVNPFWPLCLVFVVHNVSTAAVPIEGRHGRLYNVRPRGFHLQIWMAVALLSQYEYSLLSFQIFEVSLPYRRKKKAKHISFCKDTHPDCNISVHLRRP